MTRPSVFFSLVEEILERSGVDLVDLARQLERSGKTEHNGLAARIEKLRTMFKSVGDDLVDQDQRLVEQARQLADLRSRMLVRETLNGVRTKNAQKAWDLFKLILGPLLGAAVATAWAVWR